MKLCELNVQELKKELDIRGLRTDGDVDELVIRLREAMENEGLDPEIHEFEDDEIQEVEKVASVAGKNAGASSVNFDMAQVMAAMEKMMKQFTQEMKTFNQEMIKQNTQMMKQKMMGEIKQSNHEVKHEIVGVKHEIVEVKHEIEKVEQEEVKKADIEVDQRIQGSEVKLLDAGLDGTLAQVIQTVDTVELNPPTFDVTSSFGVLEDQFEAAILPDDYNMVPEYTECVKMDAFRVGVGDPDIRGGVVLSPGVTFPETVACSLTGETALETVRPTVRILRAELEQPNICGAVSDIWPRGNWPRSNWPLRKVQNGHERMKYWICGRTGHISRDGWKKRRRKVRKKVRTPSAMGHVPKEKVDALIGRRSQVDFQYCGRVEDNGSIIDVGRMQVLPAGEGIREENKWEELEDPNLSMMVKLGENDHRFDWGEIADGGSTLEACCTQWYCLSIVQGCWKRIWKGSDGGLERSLVVVPKVRIAEILRRCHGAASGTHLGIDGTLAKVRERFRCAGCRQAVAGWCRGCEQCRAARGPVKRSHELLQMSNVEGAIGRIPVNHRMRTRCVVRVHGRGFAEGRFVWLHSWQGTRGFSGRLQPEWEGPYRGIDRMDDVICRILGELHGGSRVVHLERTVLYTGGGLDPVRDEQVWAEGSVTN